MRLLLILIAMIVLTDTALACEDQALKAKVKADITKLECPSVKTVLALLYKSSDTPGRQLYKEVKNPANFSLSADFCANPEYSQKLAYAYSVADPAARQILTAAILDEAEEYSARDAVIFDAKVTPCK